MNVTVGELWAADHFICVVTLVFGPIGIWTVWRWVVDWLLGEEWNP